MAPVPSRCSTVRPVDLSYPREAEEYRAKVQDFLAATLPKGWRGLGALPTDEARTFSESWRRTLHDNGLLAAAWPIKYGGGGLS